MPDKMLDVEVFVMVDGDGNYVVHAAQGELEDLYNSEIGNNIGTTPIRVIRVALKVPVPKIITVAATLPEQGSDIVASVE